MQTNFDRIKNFLDFSDPGKFYLALVVQRKKDNPDLDRSERIIKNYMIPTLEKLEYVKDEMVTLCRVFNARVYLYINRRSFKNTQKAMVKTLVDQICANSASNLNHLFDSCSAAHGCGDKYWIIDVDLPKKPDVCSSDSYMRLESEVKMKLFDELEGMKPDLPDGGRRVQLVLPTKNGFHIVTKPFDTREWCNIVGLMSCIEEKYGLQVEIELKKDAMVNLILPPKQLDGWEYLKETHPDASQEDLSKMYDGYLRGRMSAFSESRRYYTGLIGTYKTIAKSS